MFPSTNSGRRAPRSWGIALRRVADLARAFVLLEDPIWEDGPEPRGPHGDQAAHPHRRPLRPHDRTPRPGAVQPRELLCVTPLAPAPARHVPRGRARVAC